MKTSVVILLMLLGLMDSIIKPEDADYIKIERVEAITNKITPQIVVSTMQLKSNYK